jgi:ribosomal protein S18 acetylase RimI-like enzyme
MPPIIRRAGPEDVTTLVELMAEFYAEAAFRLDPDRARAAFGRLLEDERLGQVWLAELDARAAGYLVLVTCYSMEFGGLSGWVDDLFVRPGCRNQGLAGRLLDAVRRNGAASGLRALHLEAAADNAPAQRAYRRAGFAPVERQLLTLELAPPTHVR